MPRSAHRRAAAAARRVRCVLLVFVLVASARHAWAQPGPNNIPAGNPSGRQQASFEDRLYQEGGPRFDPTGPGQQLVADVRVVGNETVPDNRIFSLLKSRKDRVFDPVVVEADVRRLISSGMFQDVRTYTQPAPQGVIVQFQVFERPTIRYIRYIGNRGVSERSLARESGLEVGEALNIYAVEEARRKIEQLYRSKGFTKAQVVIFEGDKPRDKGVVLIVNEGNLERISTVRFQGNDPNLATDARLKTRIKSKPGFMWYVGGRVDRQRIDEDVDRLVAYYRSLGYFRARISRELDYDESGKWLTLTFVIDEGPRYKIRQVSIIGNKKFETSSLAEQLQLNSGEFFNLAKMNRDVNTLRDVYGGQGHIYADINADPRFLEEPGWLDLVYNVDEGEMFRVGSVHVHIGGEYPHTRKTTVLNRLSLRPGDIIDIRQVRDSERRLKASQLFQIDPSQGSPPRIVIRPPELDEILSERPGGSKAPLIRGQSPDRPWWAPLHPFRPYSRN